MKKLIKFFSMILGILALIFLISIISITVFVNPNRFKTMIIEQVKQKTGYTLTLAGDLHWRWFPTIGLTLNNATLTNTQEIEPSPLTTIDQAEIRIKIIPLLNKKIEIETLALTGLKFNLIKDHQGKLNWQTPHKASSSPEQSAKKRSQTLQNWEFSIPQINIHDMRFTFQDLKTAQKMTFDHINLEVQKTHHKDAFPLKLSFKIQRTDPPLNGHITLTSTLKIAPPLYAFYHPVLSLHLTETACDHNLCDAHLKAKHIIIDTHHIQTEGLTLDANDTHIDGHFKSERSNTGQGQFELKANTIDLDQWLAVLQLFSKINTTQAKTPIQKQHTPHTIQIKHNLKGHISIDHLKAAHLNIQKINIQLNAKKGMIDIKPLTASFYHGTIVGAMQIDTQQKIPHITCHVTTKDVQLHSVLKDLVKRPKFSGLANLTVDLSTRGTNISEATRALEGQVKFDIKEGAFVGIDLAHYIYVGKALIKKQPISPHKNYKETAFHSLIGTAVINQGVLSNDDLHLSSNILDATGHGIIDFATKHINYHLLVSPKSDPHTKIPLKYKGHFGKKHAFKIDTTTLLTQVVKTQFKKQQDHLQSFGEKISSVLFGKPKRSQK